MFQLPAYLSLCLDACLVIVYFNNPTVLGEDQANPFENPWDPLRSYLLLAIFAGCRIILYLPYIWSFQQDRRLRMPTLPYVWHLANIAIIAIKSVDNLIVNEQNGYQWAFLLFAAVSILCQCIGLNHLKSTAIPEREVALSMATDVPADRDDTRVALLNPDGGPASERQYSNDIILAMRKRVDRAHERWNQGVSRFNQYVGFFNQDEFGPVFKHIVDLFKGNPPGEEPVIALQQHFTDHMHELEFYIPQITVFLLYGSFRNSEILQQFMFDLCAHSATLAHKIRWFVISFCLSGAGVGTVGINTLNQFLVNVEKYGIASARQLLISGVDFRKNNSGSDLSSSAGERHTMMSVPLSNRVSLDTSSTASDQHRERSYPMYRTLEIMHQSDNGFESIDAFSPNIAFWEELVQISRDLCPLSRDVRTSALKSKLDSFKNRYLPSASIFAPVGRTQHRVFNIQINECFAFSTRERAPIFVCLEVVDYDFQSKLSHDNRKKWWAVPELGITKSIKKAIDTFGDFREDNQKSRSPDRSKSRDSVDRVFMTPNLANSHSVFTAVSESAPRSTSNKPVLGDRILSAPLLSELIQDDSEQIILSECSPETLTGPGGVFLEQDPVDIEAGGESKLPHRPRTQSLPSHDCEDEVGQWGKPSLPKKILDRRPSEQQKKNGFQLGLTRWFSDAGVTISGQRSNATKTGDSTERLYENIADGPQFNNYVGRDVDVFVNSESMMVPVSDSDSKPTSSDGSDISVGYGSLKQKGIKSGSRSVSADAKVPVYEHRKSNAFPFSTDDEMEDPRTSSVDGESRLGQYSSAYGVSGRDVSVGSSQYSSSSQPLVVFKEPWAVKEKRIKKRSSVGDLQGWRLIPVIIKSGDDLRQEQVVSQLMFQIYFILQTRKVGCWLRPYGIIATSPDSGIIEAIPDTVSLDVLRRRVPAYTSLIDFYERFYGDRTSNVFLAARDNFIKSLAGYSIVCYILQLKDRHNGNILLDNKGHLMHIDFGFVLGITPGGNMGFEKAPFKLTREMIELIGGLCSAGFRKYRDICVKTFMTLRKEHHRIVLMLDMLSRGSGHLPCFQGNPEATLDSLKDRFFTDLNDNAAIERVHDLINAAANNWTTTCYDRYQRCCTGVF